MSLLHEQAMSVKELRTHFPSVAERLSRGQEFVIIHRSKPIARLSPYASGQTDSSALALWARPPAYLRFRNKKSAIQLARDERR